MGGCSSCRRVVLGGAQYTYCLLLLWPRGYPIWRKAFESSHQTSLSTLTWPFRDDFSIPAFSRFFLLPCATLFFPHTPRPTRSLLRLQYSPSRICQLLPDRFLFFFFRPASPRIFTSFCFNEPTKWCPRQKIH